MYPFSLLFSDARGRVPHVEFKEINGITWVAMNTNFDKVPPEAAKFKNLTSYHTAQTVCNPDGSFVEMEWADHLDWHRHGAQWRAWIPISKDEASEEKWFLRRPIAQMVRVNDAHKYVITPEMRDLITADLQLASECADELITKDPFMKSQSRPNRRFSVDALYKAYETVGDAYRVIMVARRYMLDYLGVIYWWTSVCDEWKQGNLTFRVMEAIDGFELSQYAKRGILIDIARDWPELNFPILLEHGIPIVYAWTRRERVERRFACLNPYLLETYQLKCLEAGGEENLEVGAAVTKHPCYVSLNSYDVYLNHVEPASEPMYSISQGKGPQQKAKAFIIEFPGWARHAVETKEMRSYYFQHFHFTLKDDEIVFQHWKEIPERIPYTGKYGGEGDSEDERVDYEDDDDPIPDAELKDLRPLARERFKGTCAPAPAPNRPLAERLTSPHHSVRRGRNLDQDDRARMPGSFSSRSSSQSSSIYWRETDRYVPDYSRRLTPAGRTREREISKGESLQRRQRSMSPPRERDSSRASTPRSLAPSRPRSPQVAPQSDWSPLFVQHAVLTLEDPGALVRFRYWACFFEIGNATELLDMAISRCVPFRLSIPESKVTTFRSPNMSNKEKEVVPRYYKRGYVERTLAWGSGGSEFCNQYFGGVDDVIERPHARCLVAAGGSVAWIALRYKPELITDYKSGPSSQVTFHNAAATDFTCDNPWFIVHDQPSEQEINLLLGHTREGSVDYYIYPPTQVLLDLSDHYGGEAGEGFWDLMGAIAAELKSERPVRRSFGAFKEFLRRRNRGRLAPKTILATANEFEDEKERVEELFEGNWSKIALRDLVLPPRCRH
ncbi:hypothetical protein B0H11DRAFT_1764898 [Mycena galericulata]|nr:hypothetical protein B0H11DRAFT_1764898 [Mycena galericulata]